jgi:hypothetical protein
MNAEQLLGLFTEVSAWKRNSRKFTVASISASQPLGDAGGAMRRFDRRLSQALAEFVAWIRCKRVQVVACELPENFRNHSWLGTNPGFHAGLRLPDVGKVLARLEGLWAQLRVDVDDGHATRCTRFPRQPDILVV